MSKLAEAKERERATAAKPQHELLQYSLPRYRCELVVQKLVGMERNAPCNGLQKQIDGIHGLLLIRAKGCKGRESGQIRHASAASFLRRMHLEPPSRLSHKVLRFEALSCAMSGRSMWVGWQTGAATFVARCFRYGEG